MTNLRIIFKQEVTYITGHAKQPENYRGDATNGFGNLVIALAILGVNSKMKAIRDVASAYNEEIKFESYLSKGLIKCEQVIFSKYVNKEDSVLDIGCYVGRVSFEVARFCRRVIGIDIASKAVEVAGKLKKKLNVRNCEYIVASATNTPFRDESFDKVLIPYNSLECIPLKRNRMKTLEECHGILRRDGLLIFSLHNRSYSGWLKDLRSFDLIRFLGKISEFLTIKLIKSIKRSVSLNLEMLIESEFHSVLWKEPNSQDFVQYYFYSKSEIAADLRKVGFKRTKFCPIEHQNPYSDQGRLANLLEERSMHRIPGFYIITIRG